MKRTCSHCGLGVTDQKEKLCPKCDTLLPPAESESTTITQEQEARIAQIVAQSLGANWWFVLKVFGLTIISITVIWTVIGAFYAKTLSDRFDQLQQQTDTRLAELDIETSNRIASVQYSIQKNIEAQFKDPHIRELMSEVAANQASNMMRLQIDPEIENFNTGVSNTLSKYNSALAAFEKQSSNAIANLTGTADFTMTLEKAGADDYQALIDLRSYTTNYNSPYLLQALTTSRLIIQKSLEQTTFNPMMTVDWTAAGVEPDKITFTQLVFFYVTMPTGLTKVRVMHDIANNEKFPKGDRLGWLMGELQSSPSIVMRFAALRLISDESKIKMTDPMYIQPQIDWWNTNKDRYTNDVPANK